MLKRSLRTLPVIQSGASIEESFQTKRQLTPVKVLSDLRVCFVHTPMSSVVVPGRDTFWRNFDKRYYAVHPESRPADAGIWELPHWMTWLGGVLKEQGFKNVSALSLYSAVNLSEGIDRAFIEKELSDHPADVYLFSPMTPNLHFAYEIAGLVKRTYPHSKVIFGGVVASPLHKEVAQHETVDFVVRDRGEIALPELLRAIESNGDLRTVNNLSYKESDQDLWISPRLNPYMEPKDIAFPFYDLFPAKIGDSLRYIRQNYALGCPFKCSFCTIQTIGRPAQYFPIDRVLSEIDAYRSHYGEHHHIYFGDETFTLNSPRTLEICEALKEHGQITYDMQTRLSSLKDDRVLAALRDSGCRWVEVGVETLIQDSLNVHKQKTKVAEIKDTLKRLRDYDLPVCSFIVNGLPEQTPDQMHRSTDMVCELLSEQLLHASYFFGIVPYPGSVMFEHPEQFGMRIKHHDYSLYNEDILPVYDTELATAEQMYDAFLAGVHKIGQAMESSPYLGVELDPTFIEHLGTSQTHV